MPCDIDPEREISSGEFSFFVVLFDIVVRGVSIFLQVHSCASNVIISIRVILVIQLDLAPARVPDIVGGWEMAAGVGGLDFVPLWLFESLFFGVVVPGYRLVL